MITNPCKGCEAPKRHPGCHDSCPEREKFVVQNLTAKREYQKKYLRGNWTTNVFNRKLSNRMARKDARRGLCLKSYGE